MYDYEVWRSFKPCVLSFFKRFRRRIGKRTVVNDYPITVLHKAYGNAAMRRSDTSRVGIECSEDVRVGGCCWMILIDVEAVGPAIGKSSQIALNFRRLLDFTTN